MKGFGLEALHAHLPDLRHPGRALLAALIAVAAFALATAAMLLVDRLWPNGALLGQIAVVAAAFVCIAPFFWRRKTYQARWGEHAYRNAFAFHVLTGLPVMFAAIIHTAFLPGERILSGWAAAAAGVIAWYLALTGAALDLRAIFTFGFDNLGMLYVYFPAEGRMVASAIYALLRHPVYSAVIRIGMALGLWRGAWASMAFGLIMPVGLTLWLRLVEEKELLDRFGEDYAEYRRKVPAFRPRRRDLGKFFRFLLRGE